MIKLMKSMSMVMILASASIAQANVVSVDEKDVSVLENAWIQTQKTSVVDNELAYKNVAILSDKLSKREPQEVVDRASKVHSEVQAALRTGYVDVLSKELNRSFGDVFNVQEKRNGIVLRIESGMMDADVARHLSDVLYVQDEAFAKDYRKVEFVNSKTGFIEVVENYKIPRVAS